MILNAFLGVCLPMFYILFDEMSMSFAHFEIKFFVSLLLSFESSLYILDISPLLDMWYENIYSQSVACIFILLTVSFPEQKLLMSMKSNLSTSFL